MRGRYIGDAVHDAGVLYGQADMLSRMRAITELPSRSDLLDIIHRRKTYTYEEINIRSA